MIERHAIELTPSGEAEAAALAVVERLRGAGHEAYMVGGAVRDRLLARRPKDVDVATSAVPEQVQALFARTYAVGAAFGVVVVLIGKQEVEVATFRVDAAYRDGRRPEAVRFSTPEEDAKRRDFTINALFYDPAAPAVVDYVGGMADLCRGIVRAIGDPAQRFAEDHLRMLRAVRFAAHLGFALDPATRAAIPPLAAEIRRISPERVFAELTRMLVGPRPALAFRLLDEVGLLAELLPEVTAMHGVEQPAAYHPEGDVWVHTLRLLELMVAPTPELAWACLLHDIGKPPTFEIGKHGRECFPCHAEIGADMAAAIMRRFRAANRTADAVVAMVANHMRFAAVQEMRPATLRRLMGRETFAAELELHRIDCSASNGLLGNWLFLLDKLHELANEPKLPPPLLSGADVLAAGVPQGPRVGALLREAQEWQLGGRLDTRAEALAWLRRQLGGDGNG